MKSKRTALIIFLFTACGAALFVVLLVRHGIGDIAAALAAAGIGIAAVVAFHAVPLLVDALAWRPLFPPAHRLPMRSLFWMRWAGEAVSTLLPFLQVGGDVIRARIAATKGVPLPIAIATILADITLSVPTQMIFTLSGLMLLASVTGHRGIIAPAVAGTLLASLAIVGFYAVQRHGMFRMLATLAGKLARSEGWNKWIRQGESLDEAVKAVYAQRAALLASAGWTMLSWAVGACEVWIALRALGLHAGYVDAYILESVGQGVRAVMFLVPGALGFQEGGYVLVGGLLGIPPDTAMALALIRRVRELAVGIPGLVIWQFSEGRRLWRTRAVAGHPI